MATVNLVKAIKVGNVVTSLGELAGGDTFVFKGDGSTVAGSLQLNDATNTYTTTLQSGATSSDITFTLPAADGSENQVLVTDGSGNLSFAANITKNDVSNTFSANQIISVSDNTNAALRITQTGTGNALVVEDSTNPDSTPFVVDASGNVGIGTTQNDFSKLELKTGAYNASQAEDGIILKLQTSEGGSAFSGGLTIQTSSGGAPTVSLVSTDDPTTRTFQPFIESSSTGTNQYTKFLTAGTERMRIDSSGNITFTASGASSTTHLFSYNENGGEIILNNNTGNNGTLIDFASSNTRMLHVLSTGNQIIGLGGTNTTGIVQFMRAGFVEAMRIDSSGNVGIGYTSSNGSYKLQVNSQIFATSATIATSDGRYKENITSLDGALNLVAQLNPVQFTWKEHPVHEFDRNQPTVGFIAQEVQEVLKDTPYVNSIIKANECTIEDAVYETIEISPAIPEELDENGEIITPAQEAVTEQRLVSDAVTEEFLGIAEGNLIALLTKALQEANTKIDALETRIQALEV